MLPFRYRMCTIIHARPANYLTTGDPQRAIIMFGARKETLDINFPWELENRNKKGIAIDLRVEQGKQIMYKMVEEADVFVSNIRSRSPYFQYIRSFLRRN